MSVIMKMQLQFNSNATEMQFLHASFSLRRVFDILVGLLFLSNVLIQSSCLKGTIWLKLTKY